MRALMKVAAFAVAASTFALAGAANAAVVVYNFTNNASNPLAGPGTLSPGTLSGSFTFDTVANTFSSVAVTIAGVQSTNLIGQYVLDTNTTSNSTNLRIRGITALNSGGQSNTNSFLNVQFGTALGGSSSQVTRIFNYAGSPANLTTPPQVVYAVAAVPEPATWGMMILGFGVVGGALRRRAKTAARITFA